MQKNLYQFAAMSGRRELSLAWWVCLPLTASGPFGPRPWSLSLSPCLLLQEGLPRCGVRQTLKLYVFAGRGNSNLTQKIVTQGPLTSFS